MSLEISTDTPTSKAIADLTWEVHQIHTHLESISSRLDAYNTVALTALTALAKLTDALVDLAVSIETRP